MALLDLENHIFEIAEKDLLSQNIDLNLFNVPNFVCAETRVEEKYYFSFNTLINNRDVLNLTNGLEAKIIQSNPVSIIKSETVEKIVQIKLQNLIYNDEECYILTIRDLTSSKRLSEVENKNRVTGLLTASVSHELLTPLKCIGSFGKELVYLITDKKTKYKAELIVSTSNLVMSQVKFLLDKNLLDQDVFTPQLEQQNIKKVVQDAAQIMKAQALMKRV